jgi:hypothetical protein
MVSLYLTLIPSFATLAFSTLFAADPNYPQCDLDNGLVAIGINNGYSYKVACESGVDSSLYTAGQIVASSTQTGWQGGRCFEWCTGHANVNTVVWNKPSCLCLSATITNSGLQATTNG